MSHHSAVERKGEFAGWCGWYLLRLVGGMSWENASTRDHVDDCLVLGVTGVAEWQNHSSCDWRLTSALTVIARIAHNSFNHRQQTCRPTCFAGIGTSPFYNGTKLPTGMSWRNGQTNCTSKVNSHMSYQQQTWTPIERRDPLTSLRQKLFSVWSTPRTTSESAESNVAQSFAKQGRLLSTVPKVHHCHMLPLWIEESVRLCSAVHHKGPPFTGIASSSRRAQPLMDMQKRRKQKKGTVHVYIKDATAS